MRNLLAPPTIQKNVKQTSSLWEKIESKYIFNWIIARKVNKVFRDDFLLNFKIVINADARLNKKLKKKVQPFRFSNIDRYVSGLGSIQK